MRLPALALTVRTLRVEARSGPHAWARIGLVLALLLALAWSLRHASLLGAPGLHFFWWLVFLDFWMATLFGIASFSGVVTEEKEGMTLGLLDLAGCGPVSILLGKSAGQLLSAFLLLLVQLPFAMLSVTMGGVSAHQVAAAFTLLGSYVVAVWGIALLASTVCRRSRAAAASTAAALLAWIAGTRLSLWWVTRGQPVALGAGWLERLLADVVAAEPFGALLEIAATGYAQPLLHHPAVAALAVGGAAAACAWLVFRRHHREEWQPAQPRGLPWRRSRSSILPRPAPGPAALTWKDFRFFVGGPHWVVLRAVVYAALLILYVEYAWQVWNPRQRLAADMAPFLYLLLQLECGVIASRFLAEEIKWRTLPALAGLPFSQKSLLWAKVRGCALVLLPIAVILGGDMLVALAGASTDQARLLVCVCVCCIGMLWLVVHATAYASVRLRRGGLAVGAATLFACSLGTGWAFSTAVPRAGTFMTEIGLISLGVCFLMAAGCLHFAIHARLKELGGHL